jgi:hypothetical protein
MDNEEFITVHFKDVEEFLKGQNVQRVLLRYLHDRGIEGEIDSDDSGRFIRYYKPNEDFDKFSMSFYHFITNGGK